MKTLILAAIRCSLMFTAVAALTFAYPAKANLITSGGFQTGNFAGSSQPSNSSNPSLAADSVVLTGTAVSFQTFLGSPNTGHLSRMLQTMPEQTSFFSVTLANQETDLVRLNVLRLSLRADVEDALRGVRGISSNDPGVSDPKPVGVVPVLPAPGTVSVPDVVPDGGSTASLLGFALLGLAALRRKFSC